MFCTFVFSGSDFLFKSILTHCDKQVQKKRLYRVIRVRQGAAAVEGSRSDECHCHTVHMSVTQNFQKHNCKDLFQIQKNGFSWFLNLFCVNSKSLEIEIHSIIRGRPDTTSYFGVGMFTKIRHQSSKSYHR